MGVTGTETDGTVTVAIATTGRRALLTETVTYLAGLRDRPDHLVASVAHEDDVDRGALSGLPFPVEMIVGPKGSCTQRNAVLEANHKGALILFLDDDFLIEDGYIDNLRRLFRDHSDVVMATGNVLADGKHGPGLTHQEALLSLSQGPQTPPDPQPYDVYSVYGCNMAIRVSALDKNPERFDEALPLYAWLEDMDMSRRMARHGRIVMDETLLGVHLGTKKGKTSGLLLGYSQIANPIYMIRKGSVQRAPALKLMLRNITANLVKSLRAEPWIDRRGRLRGNMIALKDLFRGKIAPDRILDLRPTPPAGSDPS